jgi:hypothetical protein
MGLRLSPIDRSRGSWLTALVFVLQCFSAADARAQGSGDSQLSDASIAETHDDTTYDEAERAASRFASWAERPLSLELQVGLGAPLGLLGGAVDVALLRRWSVTAGVGVSGGGLQLAASTRVRLVGNHRMAFFLETAFSGGNFSMSEDPLGVGEDTPEYDDGYYYEVEPAYWLYFGAGYELRFSRSALRAFAGWAPLLNPGDAHCVTEESRMRVTCSEAREKWGSVVPPWLPYVGVTYGYTFSL